MHNDCIDTMVKLAPGGWKAALRAVHALGAGQARGRGGGSPVAQGFCVTGVDSSPTLISLCRNHGATNWPAPSDYHAL